MIDARRAHNERFGELRSTLHATPPGELGWLRVLRSCHGWPDPSAFASEVAPYVLSHTKGWDARVMRAPVSWVERACSGDVEPALRVCRHVELVLDELSPGRCHYFERGRPLGEDGVVALASLARAGGALEQVEVLTLEQQRLGASGARALSESGGFSRLTSLTLLDEPMGPSEIEKVCGFAAKRHLRQLSLRPDDRSDVVRALDGSGALGRLESLALQGYDLVDPAEARVLLDAPALRALAMRGGLLMGFFDAALRAAPPRLRSLDLGGEEFSFGSLSQMLACDWFERLEALGLGGFEIERDEIARALERGGTRWERLDLTRATLEPGCIELLGTTGLPKLRELLAKSFIDDLSEWESFAHDSGAFPRLRRLSLSLDDWDFAPRLARIVGRHGVEALGLESVLFDAPPPVDVAYLLEGLVSPRTLRELSTSGEPWVADALERVESLGDVRVLRMTMGEVGAGDLDMLVSRPWSATLELLDLRGCLLDEQEVARARRALPGCEIVWYPWGHEWFDGFETG